MSISTLSNDNHFKQFGLSLNWAQVNKMTSSVQQKNGTSPLKQSAMAMSLSSSLLIFCPLRCQKKTEMIIYKKHEQYYLKDAKSLYLKNNAKGMLTIFCIRPTYCMTRTWISFSGLSQSLVWLFYKSSRVFEEKHPQLFRIACVLGLDFF